MLVYLLGTVMGLVRFVIVTLQFGATDVLDAYYAAFRIPDLLFNVIAGGALGSAFIPVFAGLLARGETAKAWQVTSGVLNSLLFVVALLAGGIALFTPWLVANVLAPGWATNPTQVQLTANLIRILLGSFILFSISGLLMGIHNAHEHFLIPALATVIYNVGIIFGAVFLSPRWGVYGLAVGVVLGALGHLILQLPRFFRYHPRYSPSFLLHLPEVRQVGKLVVPRMFGAAVWEINAWVNVAIASLMLPGTVSAMNVAFQIFTTPQIIISRAVGTVSFPLFSRLASQGKKDELGKAFLDSVQQVLYLAIPTTAALLLLGYSTAKLFESEKLPNESVLLVSWILAGYAVGLIGHSVLEIVSRMYFALKDTRTPVLVGAGAMLLNVALSLGLYWSLRPHFQYAAISLSLANSIATAIETYLLVRWLSPKLPTLDWQAFRQEIVKHSLGALMMSGGVGGLLWASSNIWVRLMGGSVLGLILYFGVTYWLGSQEAQKQGRLLGQVWGRLRR